MFSAAQKIGSDFWRSESSVKNQLGKFAPDSKNAPAFTLVKFCRFAFLRPAFARPRFARPAFGVARITSKSRSKATKKRQKPNIKT